MDRVMRVIISRQASDPQRIMGNTTRILWQNTSGAYVAGLDELFPIDTVACLDDGTDHDLIAAERDIRFCSLEPRTRERSRAHDPAIEDIVPGLEGSLRQILDRHPRSSWVIACPRPCRTLEAFVSAGGYRSALHPAEIGIWLYHKARLFQALDELGLPRLPGRWMSLSGRSYPELAAEMTSRFVVQLPVGWSGSGTTIVATESDYTTAGARVGSELVWVAPYAGSTSVNINALALPGGAVAGCPSVQLAGQAQLCSKPGTYCGNDFDAAHELPAETLTDITAQTEAIGRWLSGLDFHGLYGLDFVLDADTGKAFAVDLNPRSQGSTAISTQAEQAAGRRSLAAAELAWKLGELSEAEILAGSDTFRDGLPCSQMVLHSLLTEPARVCGHVAPGIYRLDSELTFLRPATRLESCQRGDELLITGGIVRPGTTIHPGANIARIFQRNTCTEAGTPRLTASSARAVEQLYALFDLRSTQD